MRFRTSLVLAIVGYAVAASPLALAQNTASDTKSKTQATAPHAGANTMSPNDASSTNGGAQKQSTQGLPSSLIPDTNSSWNGQKGATSATKSN